MSDQEQQITQAEEPVVAAPNAPQDTETAVESTDNKADQPVPKPAEVGSSECTNNQDSDKAIEREYPERVVDPSVADSKEGEQSNDAKVQDGDEKADPLGAEKVAAESANEEATETKNQQVKIETSEKVDSIESEKNVDLSAPATVEGGDEMLTEKNEEHEDNTEVKMDTSTTSVDTKHVQQQPPPQQQQQPQQQLQQANEAPQSMMKQQPQTLPTRQYLDATVVPILHSALSQLAKIRPDDPIHFLGQYLLDNKDNFNVEK